MLQLCDVLQFVVDRLNDRPFAKQYLVGDAHQAVLHVALHLGYQPDARVEVYDANGRLVHSQGITENVTAINAEAWAGGVYVWKVYSGVSTLR